MNSLDDFDKSKFKLGRLCPKKHRHGNTNQSLRYISIGRCVECKKDGDAKFREKQDKQKVSEYNKAYREANRDKLIQQSQEYWEKTRDLQLIKKKERYEANREQILQKQKEYKEKNKDKVKEMRRLWYLSLSQEQRDKRNAYGREQYAKNAESERARSFRYRESNPEKRAETCRNYRHSHRNIQNANNIERRKRLASQSDGSITPQFLSRIFSQTNNCLYCGCDLVESVAVGRWEDVKTLDHIVPLASGGGHAQENVIVCCRQCNIKKGTMDFSKWIDMLDEPYKTEALAMYRSKNNANPS